MFEVGRHSLPKMDPTLLRIRLIGSMEARSMRSESVLPIGGKTRGLLAVLALANRRPVTRPRLAELLWSQRPEELARASLRQEIHRLLDALSPLGVDVIDVQRHTLALKPALTSVDVERVYAVGLPAIRELEEPFAPLLADLNGIDPAFDGWLEEQRTGLTRHIQSVLTRALQEEVDADTLFAIADQLLSGDEYNESAWRARMQAAVLQGEHAKALEFGRKMLEMFESRLGRPPGPVTMDLLSSLQAAAVPAAKRSAFSDSDRDAPSRELFSAEDGEGILSLTPPSTLRSASEAARRLAMIAVAPVMLPPDMESGVSFELGDALDVTLSRQHLFGVLPAPQRTDTVERGYAETCRKAGADFLLTTAVRKMAGGATAARTSIIFRLIDLRYDNGIVWARKIVFDDGVGDMRAVLPSLMGVGIALQWAVLQFEGRVQAPRSVRELSHGGRALRALMLLMRCDVALFPQIGMLLETRQSEAGSLRDLATALFASVRAVSYRTPDEDETQLEALSLLQECQAQTPQSPISRLALAYVTFRMPGHAPMAEALTASLVNDGPDDGGLPPDLPACSLLQAFAAAHHGHWEEASRRTEDYLAARHEDPSCVLTEPSAIMLLLLVGRSNEAVRMSRSYVCTFPRFPAALIYYVAALVEAGLDSELEIARAQLLALCPSLSLDQLMKRHMFLPEEAQERLRRAWLKSGVVHEDNKTTACLA